MKYFKVIGKIRKRSSFVFEVWTVRAVLIFFISIGISCASYYQKNIDFNSEFQHGDLQGALTTLQKNEHEAYGRSKFIYYANNGLLLSVLGKYPESNDFLEKAFLFGEDYRINYLNEATSYLYNPNLIVYPGEDHEHLMVLYLKALNYLKMGKPEDALVECRRLNIRLQQLSDKYSSDNKYKRDAFVHTLMGIIYQSTKDYNNAFIAYRNALEIYEDDYGRMFNVQAPEQLKTDLLNTAYWTGLKDEFEYYKTKFGKPDYVPLQPQSELVFFWHNGLCPVKDEWSINFFIEHEPNNVVVFANPTLGIRFPFQLENDKNKSDLTNLEMFRVAFPKYVERPAYFQHGVIGLDSVTYPLELSEDLSKIAFFSLHERMMLEFSKGLLRAGLKKAAEESLKKEDHTLGTLIGIVNTLTEKADTRNWQTLPHSILYSRVPMKEGANTIEFTITSDDNFKTNYNFTYQATKGQTLFHTFSSLETTSQPYRNY